VGIAHNSSSTTAAQQVLVTLSLPYALVPVVESLSWTGGPATVAVLATASSDLSTVTLLLYNGLALPASGDLPFVITFQLMLNVSIQPSVPYNGSQAFQWTTAPASTTPAVWRAYYVSGLPNPLFQLTSRAMPAVGSLKLLSTSQSLPYPQLSIGEHTVFSLHSELIQGTTAGVQLRVTMPMASDGTTLLFAVLSAVPSLGAQLTASAVAVSVETPQVVVIDFGTVVNTPDGAYDANDMLGVSIEAQLLDVPSVLAGLNVSTSAVERWTSATGAHPTLQNVALPDLLTLVVEPDLRLRVDWHQEDQGDVSNDVPFAVTLVHAEYSSAAAYNISIVVPLPAGLTPRDGSVTGCSPPFCTATFFNNTLYLDLPQLLLTDGEQVVRQRGHRPGPAAGHAVPADRLAHCLQRARPGGARAAGPLVRARQCHADVGRGTAAVLVVRAARAG